jgi:hypothetical protein
VDIKCVNKRGYYRHDNYSIKVLEKIRVMFIIEQIKIHKNEFLMMIDADVIFSGINFIDEMMKNETKQIQKSLIKQFALDNALILQTQNNNGEQE